MYMLSRKLLTTLLAEGLPFVSMIADLVEIGSAFYELYLAYQE